MTNVRISRPVRIGNKVCIGANCTVLPGTVIKDNVVVGAGSVVKGILESNRLYVGVPSRKVRNALYKEDMPLLKLMTQLRNHRLASLASQQSRR